jgi:flavin-dependent dehydrogenase
MLAYTSARNLSLIVPACSRSYHPLFHLLQALDDWHHLGFIVNQRKDGSEPALDGKIQYIETERYKYVTGMAERCSIRSSVIVDATGRSASIARKNGAHQKRYDNLIAISGVVGTTEKMKPDQIFTLIESTYSGWWYSSVASTRTLVGTFMTDGPLSGPSLKSYWKSQLAKSQFTHPRFINSIEAASVRCLSAATMKTEPMATPTLFTVGDAAMTHDPLSSHGIQNALTSGQMAGVAINDTLRGKASSPAEYSRRLEADFERYLRLRSRYYSRVGRFQASSFWNTRGEQHATR